MTCRLGSISDSNQHIIPVSVDRNADQLEPTRFENYSLADAADKKRRDLIYSQQIAYITKNWSPFESELRQPNQILCFELSIALQTR
ncbi:hypothetical protein AVEN_14584-1 [Araneus ventricosus]|uniref:Uncharacterized protein n=1 Tax=Araneus ventricosus TaxID=182803 RepID=A0A4Y2CIE5_ARAVE|nr:hypothetical protein AVEN_14584-1 [Araneus ventricosus]